MPAREAVGITNQIGVETTYGVGVSAAKRFSSLGFDFSPFVAIRHFRRMGARVITAKSKNREWGVGSYQGILSFNEIVYVMAGLFGHGTVTQIGSTGAYTWPFSLPTVGGPARKTYTMQKGDAEAASEMNGSAFASIIFEFGDEGPEISGGIIGGIIDEAATLDTVTSTLAESPSVASDIDWYIDATYGGIGGTKWTDVLSASITIPELIAPKFVQNTAHKSIRELVGIAAEDMRLVIRAENNAQTRSILAAMKTDSLPVRFAQCKIIGDNLGTNADQLFKSNMAISYEGDSDITNIQNVYGKEITFRIQHSDTMGTAFESTVVNSIPAL